MTITEAVVRELRRIARQDRPANWMGFDDADVQWFLADYKEKDGPELSRLRAAYADGLNQCATSREITLWFWRPSQTHARALLEEIQ